jgi:hypothetical protein
MFEDDFRSWHKCEVPQCQLYRRYRGQSGSDLDIVKLAQLTPEQTWPAQPANHYFFNVSNIDRRLRNSRAAGVGN